MVVKSAKQAKRFHIPAGELRTHQSLRPMGIQASCTSLFSFRWYDKFFSSPCLCFVLGVEPSIISCTISTAPVIIDPSPQTLGILALMMDFYGHGTTSWPFWPFFVDGYSLLWLLCSCCFLDSGFLLLMMLLEIPVPRIRVSARSLCLATPVRKSAQGSECSGRDGDKRLCLWSSSAWNTVH